MATLAPNLARVLGLLISLATGSAHAVGLGSVELATALNQRLDARIPVRDLEDHLPDTVSVGLASPARFRAAGIERHPQLQGLRFAVERTPSGGHMIRVRSSRPIVEPFLRFLIELEWPSGRLIREYTMLLDPPGTTPDAQSLAVADSGRAAPSNDEAPQPANRSPRASGRSAAGETTVTAERRYGPVRTGSSAWEIAADVRPPGANIYQTMIALYQANPDAFRNNDLGLIKAGVPLAIPPAETITGIPRARAAALYRQHIEPAPADGGTETAAGGKATDDDAPRTATVLADAPGSGADDTDAGGSEPGGHAAAVPATAAVDGSRETEGAGVPTEGEDPFGPLRADLAELKAMVAELRSGKDADPSTTPAEENLQASVASLTSETERLRGELATVREKLALARAQGQERTWAPVIEASGIVGLMTLLSAGAGGLGGFLSARRFNGRRPDDPATAVGSPMRQAETVARSPVGLEPVADRPRDAGPNAVSPRPVAVASGQLDSLAVDVSDEGTGRETQERPSSAAHADFALSLADVYMASGWWEDAEAILRDAIEQQGDGPLYRARLLRALYELGRRDCFLEAFDAYRTVADPADPGWEEIRRMGRTLWPDNSVFTTPADGGDAASDDYETEFDIDFELVLDDLSPTPPPSPTWESGPEEDGHPGDGRGSRGVSSARDGDNDNDDRSRQ